MLRRKKENKKNSKKMNNNDDSDRNDDNSYEESETNGYQLNILGWNKLKMIEQDPYSEVFRTNNHHLMNLMYTVAIVTWSR